MRTFHKISGTDKRFKRKTRCCSRNENSQHKWTQTAYEGLFTYIAFKNVSEKNQSKEQKEGQIYFASCLRQSLAKRMGINGMGKEELEGGCNVLH